MTRVLTVSQLKGMKQGPGTREIPSEGTVIRGIYDALRRGELVSCKTNTERCSLEYLRNNYGMIIRHVYNRDGKVGRPTVEFLLVGEWYGPIYVPVERILQEDMEAKS